MSLSPQSPPPPPSQSSSLTAIDGGVTTIADVHPDILLTHILTRLDGPTLAAVSCASSALHTLATADHHDHNLWSKLCRSVWPSTTTTPRIEHLISTFPPHGPRSFFSNSFSLLLSDPQNPPNPSSSPALDELISAVDIRYKSNLIFSKVQETETVTGWFRCSPFRIDLLDPKDVVVTPIRQPEDDVTCRELSTDMTLSWILIDPIGRRAVNLSSHKPVSVHRHWLSGEVQVRYASILAVDQKEFVQCGIVVTCGASEGGEMQVREVSLQVEDMDGMHFDGKDSLVVLQGLLEGKRGKNGKNGEEAKKRYEEYLEMKRERRERKLRTEGRLDSLCMAIGVTLFFTFFFFISCM